MPEKEKKKPRDCLTEIKDNQDIVNALTLLQQRNMEHYGFYKDGKLKQVKRGDHSSVRIEVTPEGEQQCEFHTHPDHPQKEIDLNEFDLTEIIEMECGAGSSRTRLSMLSDADAFIQLELRPPIDLTSILVSNDLVTQYVLADMNKYAEFKKEVTEEYGNDEEINIGKALHKKRVKFFNEAKTEIYDEQQNFSHCGEEQIWTKTKEKWYSFLRSIGMQIKEQPLVFKGDPAELEKIEKLLDKAEELEIEEILEKLGVKNNEE